MTLESSTQLQMHFLEFTTLARMGIQFMISMHRCVIRVSLVCITLFVQRIVVTVFDEFSCFPFTLPCSIIDAKTVTSYLNRLRALFGMPACSDRGAAFMSHALTSYLHRYGVACSKTSVSEVYALGVFTRLLSYLKRHFRSVLAVMNCAVAGQ